MTKQKVKEAQIPFSGHYESYASAMVDDIEETEIEYLRDETDRKFNHETLWEYMDYKQIQAEYNLLYTEAFFEWFNELIGFEIKQISFPRMESPRECNFETDRLFVDLKASDIKKLRNYVSEDNLKATLIDNCTSYDGFISLYSSDLDDWPKDLMQWDHNHLHLLIKACIKTSKEEIPNDYELFENINGREKLSSCVFEEIDNAIKEQEKK